jgi:hypothetical protein
MKHTRLKVGLEWRLKGYLKGLLLMIANINGAVILGVLVKGPSVFPPFGRELEAARF